MKRKRPSSSFTEEKVTLPFGGVELPKGTILYRGIPGGSSCSFESGARHAWFGRDEQTARNYAKPTLCSYQTTKPLLTVNLSPGNVRFLYREMKSQLGAQAKLNRLALAFGYDPRSDKMLSCSDIPSLSKKIRRPISAPEFLSSVASTTPSGRCSFVDIDNRVLKSFCSYLDHNSPWIAGYSSPATPHRSGRQFHEEVVLCHPSSELLRMDRKINLLDEAKEERKRQKLGEPLVIEFALDRKIPPLAFPYSSTTTKQDLLVAIDDLLRQNFDWFSDYSQNAKLNDRHPELIADGLIVKDSARAGELAEKDRVVFVYTAAKAPL